MERTQDPCIACTFEEAETLFSGSGHFHQACPRCGEFKATGTAQSILSTSIGKDKRALISGWIYDQNQSGSKALLTSYNLPEIMAREIPSVRERVLRLLIEGASKADGLKAHFNVTEPRFLAATYSSEISDVHVLSGILEEEGLIEHRSMGGTAHISSRGFMQLDELKTKLSTSSVSFVAMWFDAELEAAYSEGIEKAILRSGYDSIRVDKIEHANKIDDEIIARIKASKFVVADFTGQRGGVYFEAGFALGRDIPVIWTCRKDEIEKLHFDIRQFNCIDWEAPAELEVRLYNRIEAVIGLGPKQR